MFAGGATLFLIVPFLELEFGLTVQGERELVFGLMSSMSAAVGILFALYLAKKKSISKPVTLMTFSLVLAGIILMGFGVATELWMLALAWTGFGAIEVAIAIPLQTITQETVPDKLRGKVFSFINLAMTFSQIMGMGLVSILAASLLGLRGTFVLNGGLMIVFAMLGFIWLKLGSLETITQQKRDEFHYQSDT
jgi:MFS family permease